MVQLVLLIAALVFFILAAIGISNAKIGLEAAGLACLAGALLAGKYTV